MNRVAVLLAGLGSLIVLGEVKADSLWDRRDPYFANLFWDTKARRVGDVLTIEIREATRFDGRENRNLQKDTRIGSILNMAMGYQAGEATSRNFEGSWDVSSESERQLTGRADYRSDRLLTDRMAVQVVQVLPNGNLIIEGFRTRVVANEERIMRVSGIVRPIDIGVRNIVQSQFIANFTVEYIGRGTESRYINHGWLGQLFHKIWPY